MTRQKIDALPGKEQLLARASHDYYLALLRGVSEVERRRLRAAWLRELQERWPGVLEPV